MTPHRLLPVLLALGVGLVALSGCYPEGSARPKTAFFDTAGYFKSELFRLRAKNQGKLRKTITHNGQKATQTIDYPRDWATELALFARLNLDRPAWHEKYTIDSIRDRDLRLVRIKYTSLDPALFTQSLDVQFRNGEIFSVGAVNRVQNLLYTSEQYLEYTASKGYSIKQLEQTRFFDPQSYQIEVDFL